MIAREVCIENGFSYTGHYELLRNPKFKQGSLTEYMFVEVSTRSGSDEGNGWLHSLTTTSFADRHLEKVQSLS